MILGINWVKLIVHSFVISDIFRLTIVNVYFIYFSSFKIFEKTVDVEDGVLVHCSKNHLVKLVGIHVCVWIVDSIFAPHQRTTWYLFSWILWFRLCEMGISTINSTCYTETEIARHIIVQSWNLIVLKVLLNHILEHVSQMTIHQAEFTVWILKAIPAWLFTLTLLHDYTLQNRYTFKSTTLIAVSLTECYRINFVNDRLSRIFKTKFFVET